MPQPWSLPANPRPHVASRKDLRITEGVEGLPGTVRNCHAALTSGAPRPQPALGPWKERHGLVAARRILKTRCRGRVQVQTLHYLSALELIQTHHLTWETPKAGIPFSRPIPGTFRASSQRQSSMHGIEGEARVGTSSDHHNRCKLSQAVLDLPVNETLHDYSPSARLRFCTLNLPPLQFPSMGIESYAVLA